MATILIVDNHAPSRAFLQALLASSGHRLVAAADGHEALALCHQHRPKLIISDILLLTMDGYELVQLILADALLAATPVIFFTASYRENEALNLARTCGVAYVIGKSTAPEHILQLLQSILGAITPPLPAPPSSLAVIAAPRFSASNHQLPRYLEDLDQWIQRLSRQALRLPSGAAPFAGGVGDAWQASCGDGQLMHMQSVGLRLTALIDLGIQLAAERNPVKLLELGCRLAQDICVARHASLCMVDRQGEPIGSTIRRGWDNTRPPWGRSAWVRPGDAPAGRAFHAGDDALPHGLPHGHPPVRSSLGVPITTGHRVYGWLLLANKLGEPQFSEIDERIASTVAAQLAIAYENLVRYRQIASNHAQLEVDLALRKLSEQYLLVSDQALKSVSQGVIITGTDQLIVSVNEAFTVITGHAQADVAGRNCSFLQGPASDPATVAAIGVALRSGVEYSGEVLNYHKDGSTFWNDLTISPVRDTHGQLINFVGVLRDISTRKLAEQEALA